MLFHINYNMPQGNVGEKVLPVPAPVAGPGREFARAHKAAPENTDPLIGNRLSNRYRILEKIGEGGMGKVYLAEDERLGKSVVVKMLPHAFRHKVELRMRFAQEAKLASQLEHPNIVFITDFVVDSPPYYVMEYLKGKDLAAVLEEEKRLQWDERLKEMMVQMCSALGAAHAKGVIHRDMKPENVFVVEQSDGREFVKVFDFGIAKLISESSEEGRGSEPADIALSDTGRFDLTGADMVVGTPYYMAPEQIQGENVDHRADIYSVGVLMYELLTGHAPFEAPEKVRMNREMAERVMKMHINEPPVPPRARNPEANIPEEVEAIVMRALEKNPDGRFQSMDEMRAAILRCAAPKHKPKARIEQNGTSESRSAEGLARIQREEARRSLGARIRTGIMIGALAAAAAGGAAAAKYFGLLDPAVDSASQEGAPEQVQPASDGE